MSKVEAVVDQVSGTNTGIANDGDNKLGVKDSSMEDMGEDPDAELLSLL